MCRASHWQSTIRLSFPYHIR